MTRLAVAHGVARARSDELYVGFPLLGYWSTEVNTHDR